MSTNQVIGVVLIVIGLVAFWYQGTVKLRTREKVAEAGPVQVSAERTRNIPVAPVIGGIAIIAGIILLTR